MAQMCYYMKNLPGELMQNKVLPALPSRDKSQYPYAFIQFNGGENANSMALYFTDQPGTISEENGEKVLTIGAHKRLVYFVALTEEAVQELQTAFPGISTTEWLAYAEESVDSLFYSYLWWASYDLCYEDGTVYLNSTKIVWTKLTDFMNALAMGLASKARIPRPKTPTSYLYNGVQLPPLPEWDREGYPYLMMNYASSTNYYYLWAFKEKPVTTYMDAYLGNGYDKHGMASEDDYVSASFSPTFGGGWVTSENTGTLTVALSTINWANYDVYTSDGELFLSASEPVPVPQGKILSYNGEMIAELPEWDKVAYPYAIIVNYLPGNPDQTGYSLYCYAEQPTISDAGTGYGNYNGGARITCTTNNERTCWWGFTNSSTMQATSYLTDILWTNHDIYDADGNLFMAASEPV